MSWNAKETSVLQLAPEPASITTRLPRRGVSHRKTFPRSLDFIGPRPDATHKHSDRMPPHFGVEVMLNMFARAINGGSYLSIPPCSTEHKLPMWTPQTVWRNVACLHVEGLGRYN